MTSSNCPPVWVDHRNALAELCEELGSLEARFAEDANVLRLLLLDIERKWRAINEHFPHVSEFFNSDFEMLESLALMYLERFKADRAELRHLIEQGQGVILE